MNKNLLPQALEVQLEELLNKKHAIFLDKRSFTISASEDESVVTSSVTLRNKDDSFHYPIETRLSYDPAEMTAQQSAVFLIDYIDLYFEQYFEEGEDLLLPIAWAKHNYDAVEFEIRGQIRNKCVEDMADRLLENSTQLN